MATPENTVGIETEVSWCAGFDIAQRRDFAAGVILKRERKIFTVAEIVQPDRMRNKIVKDLPRYSIEWLYKWPLGIPYTQLASDITDLMTTYEQLRDAPAIIDRTGIGLSVFERLIENGLPEVIGVSYGANFVENQTDQVGREWTVGKQLLMTRAEAAMADGRYRFNPDQPYAADLQRELHAIQITTRPGSASSSIQGVGQHDDLVNALALATWWLNRKYDVSTGMGCTVGPLPWEVI